MEERGNEVDHATLNRWWLSLGRWRYKHQSRKPTAKSWRMDKTIRLKNRDLQYRAVDNTGKTLDFMLSERHATRLAARRFSTIGTGLACLTVVIIKERHQSALGLQASM
jgi:putative transposase